MIFQSKQAYSRLYCRVITLGYSSMTEIRLDPKRRSPLAMVDENFLLRIPALREGILFPQEHVDYPEKKWILVKVGGGRVCS